MLSVLWRPAAPGSELDMFCRSMDTYKDYGNVIICYVYVDSIFVSGGGAGVDLPTFIYLACKGVGGGGLVPGGPVPGCPACCVSALLRW